MVIAMCLASAIQLLTPTAAQSYLETVLMHLHFFIDEYPSKVYAMALTDLIRKYDHPVVARNFVHIMDCLVTLLRVSFNRTMTDEDMAPVEEEAKSAD